MSDQSGYTQKDLRRLLSGLLYKDENFHMKFTISFWTFDGRIFAKVTQESGKQLIKNLDDVRHLVR